MVNRLGSVFRTCGSGFVVLAILWFSGCGGGATPTGGNGSGGVPDNVSVNISPKRAIGLARGQSQPFTATVSGDSRNRGVIWKVDGATAGNATVGLIDSSGLYTAPSSGGTHTIAATSVRTRPRATLRPLPSLI
jgi:hypothetical protein